jgi:hypothetical protein
LPERYPSYATCYRRFSRWVRDGTLRKILEALAEDLYRRGKIDLEECFVDASFVSGKKGVPKSVEHAVAKAPRSWQWQTLMVFQSPFSLEVLHRLKSPLFTKLSNKIFLPMLRDDSLLTALMIVTDSLGHSLKKEQNSSLLTVQIG